MSKIKNTLSGLTATFGAVAGYGLLTNSYPEDMLPVVAVTMLASIPINMALMIHGSYKLSQNQNETPINTSTESILNMLSLSFAGAGLVCSVKLPLILPVLCMSVAATTRLLSDIKEQKSQKPAPKP